MILPAALALSLLTADAPALPPGHPAVQPGQSAPPLTPDQKELPPNHPAFPGMEQAQPSSMPSGMGSTLPSNEELLKQAEASGHLKDRDKPFEAAYGLGKLYFVNARYPEAAEFLRQAETKAEPARAFVADARKKWGSKPVPAPNSVGCEVNKDFKMDAMLALAKEKAKAGQLGAAVACGALATMSLEETMELRARALFIEGDRQGALTEYDRLLELNPARPTALYGRALTRVDWDADDVPGLKKSKADLEKAKALLGDQPPPDLAKWQQRIDALIAAGGMTKDAAKRAAERRAHPVDVSNAGPHVAMGGPMSGGQAGPMAAGPTSGGAGGPPPLTKDMVDAVQNTERTPELEAGLAKLVEQGEDLLAKGQYQDALDAYKRVVPFEPENGRAKAGMAWALVGLGKPMADRIWDVAVSSDPAAVDGLGKTLQQKGDAKGAKALWAKLASSDPSYASKSGLAERIQ